MSAVLVASITELCAADHHHDPVLLDAWLANKTPDGVTAWFGNRGSVLLVAERAGELPAVGGYFAGTRTISLNYVSPRHRFAGVSTALLAALEAGLGPGDAQLDATGTARRFYESRGWVADGDPMRHCGIFCHPMRKLLV